MALLAARVAETFGDTAEGARSSAALPNLRRHGRALCRLCSPVPGEGGGLSPLRRSRRLGGSAPPTAQEAHFRRIRHEHSSDLPRLPCRIPYGRGLPSAGGSPAPSAVRNKQHQQPSCWKRPNLPRRRSSYPPPKLRVVVDSDLFGLPSSWGWPRLPWQALSSGPRFMRGGIRFRLTLLK